MNKEDIKMRTAQQKGRHEAILKQLASSYITFTDPRFSPYPDTWAEHINTYYDDEGRYFIDRCLSNSKETKLIMDIITNGLIGKDVIDCDNAEVACHMFQELYKHNPDIKKHIDDAFGNRPSTIKQLSDGAPLKSLLIAKRIYEEATGVTPPLEDDPTVIRNSRPTLMPNWRATDLESIHKFNAEHRRPDHEAEDHLSSTGPK